LLKKLFRDSYFETAHISPTRDHLPTSNHPPNSVTLPLSTPRPNPPTVPASTLLQGIRVLSGPRSHPSQLSFPSPPRLELSLSPLRGHSLRVPLPLAMLLRDHVQHVPAMSVEFDMLQLAAV